MGPEGDVVYPDYLFVPDPRLIFKIHLAQLAGGVGVGEISHNIGRIPLVHLKPLRVLRDVGWTSGGVIEGYHRFMQSIRMGEAKFSQK